MNADKFDTWLQQTLREEEDYLFDNGFTERVMVALPPANINARREKLWSWGVGVAASLVAMLFLPWQAMLGTLQSTDTQAWVMVAAVPGLLVTLGSLAWGMISFRQPL